MQAGQLQGVMREAADIGKAMARGDRQDRIELWMYGKLSAAPGRRMRQSDLFHAAKPADRVMLRAMLNTAVRANTIECLSDVSTQPPTTWWALL